MLLLYGLSFWHTFLGDVRPVTAGHLHLIFAQKKKKGVRLGLLSTFPDFEKKFAGGDKLYFSPFFLSCTLLKNNKYLSSL